MHIIEKEAEQIKKCLERITILKKDKNYIEAFLFGFILLEKFTRELIDSYKNLIQLIINNINLADIKFNKDKVDKKNPTFGEIIKRLEIYHNKEEDIKKCIKFNDLRKDFIHCFFDKELVKLDQRAQKELPELENLILNISHRNQFIVGKSLEFITKKLKS